MITIGAFEAKTNLSKLLDQVANGEQVTITRHGSPVARLIPAEPVTDSAGAVVLLRELSVSATLGGESVAELIAEGRKC